MHGLVNARPAAHLSQKSCAAPHHRSAALQHPLRILEILGGSALVLALALLPAPKAHASPPPSQDQVQITAQLRQRAKDESSAPRAVISQPLVASHSAESCVLPDLGATPVHRINNPGTWPNLSWSNTVLTPPFPDHQKRLPPRAHLAPFGHTLKIGERFAFDVSYAGNPAGFASVLVAGIEKGLPDSPYPDGEVVRIEGAVRTSGVLSILTTLTDHMTTWVDRDTGAPLRTLNILDQEGFAIKYKHRETQSDFQGRGYVRIRDVRDGRERRRSKKLPSDTFDPMSGLAWVRSLNLKKGETAIAHALDGSVLMRLEVTNRGPTELKPLPSVAVGLGVSQSDIDMYEGRMIRVNRYDRPTPGKRQYYFRAWIDRRPPKLPLALESDMWLGVVRVALSHYDPPSKRRASKAGQPKKPRPTKN